MQLNSVWKFLGKPFLYYPELALKLGISTNACVFYCYVSWKTIEETDHWVTLSSEVIEKATGLSDREQRTARAALIEKKLIAENYRRIEHKLYFKILAFEVEVDDENKSEASDKSAVASSDKSAVRETHEMQEASDKSAVRHIQEQTSTNKTTKTKRANAPVIVVSPVQEFCDKWEGAHEEAFGDKGVLATKRSVATLLACGLSPDALIEVARKAWAVKDAKAFWCPRARSMKTFCDRLDDIQAELAKPNGAPKVESHQMQEDIKVRVHRTGPNGEDVVSYE